LVRIGRRPPARPRARARRIIHGRSGGQTGLPRATPLGESIRRHRRAARSLPPTSIDLAAQAAARDSEERVLQVEKEFARTRSDLKAAHVRLPTGSPADSLKA
jgi:hypothetical protein